MRVIFQVAIAAFMVLVASTSFAQTEQPIQPVETVNNTKLLGQIQLIEPIQMVELMRVPKIKQEVNYQGEFNVSYGFASVADKFPGIINFETIHGIKVGHKIAVGLGVGLNMFKDQYTVYYMYYNRPPQKLYVMPIFIDIKWYPLDKPISPYFALDLGASVSLGDHESKYQGLYIAGGAGVSFKMNYKGAFNLGIVFKTHQLYPTINLNSDLKASISSFDIKAGIVF